MASVRGHYVDLCPCLEYKRGEASEVSFLLLFRDTQISSRLLLPWIRMFVLPSLTVEVCGA